ncbi:hypothetical protein [Streptomyces sp. ME02-6978.2a]|uniref:glycosyltransferase n=1 Tax=Streptomyces sp. ME02-6978.2a TaxID=462922 RepID=UPI0029A9CB53|nr:hypothetical protein [Streptomyces sp. ME02-6978.2a]MDX3363673.1 hypothetical protein [Streptomyces sp. ME02-6978.2a]
MVVSGSWFVWLAGAVGVVLVPLAGPAGFGDRRLGELRAWLHELSPGRVFLGALFGWLTDMGPTQSAVLQQVLAQQPDAAVLHGAAFCGTWPQLLGAPGIRSRRTVGLGIFPLTLSGAGLTMMGPPLPRAGLDVRGAAAAFNAELAAQLTGATAHAQYVMAGLGATAMLPVISDAQILLPGVFAQLTVPSFEYPRIDAPPALRLIGALPPGPPTAWQPPSWWPGLSQRRVVALAQGTVADHDLTDLVQPALDALADEDVLVVAGLGGRENVAGELRVPSNARVVERAC